tara:strand:- start:8166 stop:10205 length:2040 start_codon:yes stop_codon:yes gene_type:complete
MKAIILAGGFGTRLRSVAPDIPKPMIHVASKPFLEYQIRLLKEHGVKEIIIAVHHLADQIKSYFGNGQRWAVDITYSEEEVPLGTAGAIKKAEKYIDNTFLVLNGDSYSNLDLQKLIDFHKAKRSTSTIVLTKSSDSSHYGNVVLQEEKITGFVEKKESPSLDNSINAGIYVFEPRIFDYIPADKKVSLEEEVFPKLAKEGELWGFNHQGYFMDVGRPETFSKFKQDVLNTAVLKENNNVRDAMNQMAKSGIQITLITDDQRKLLGVLTDRLMKLYLLKGGNLDDSLSKAMVRDPQIGRTSDSQEKRQEALKAGLKHLPIIDEQGKLVDVEFFSERIKRESFPIVRGRAPLRVSFAGGGTDLPQFFEKYGGIVINATIDKYCYATLVKRADSRIHINSDLGEELIIDSQKDLIYNSKFDLIKAIINIMKPDFGFELYLYNDIPPGRGLGSSATLAVLIISLISSLQEIQYDDYKIAEIAFKAEREELKIKGGWQDQYAAVTGGFNFMEFSGEKTLIYPLKLKEEVINELNEHLTLCYVGQSHFSGDQHKEQEAQFSRDEEKITKVQEQHKNIAVQIKDSLLKNELESLGSLLHESWESKKKLSPVISNTKINEIYETGIKNGAYGGRLLGSGGGGYILFFHSPTKRNQLTRALSNASGEIMPFNFEFQGTKIWPVKSKT